MLLSFCKSKGVILSVFKQQVQSNKSMRKLPNILREKCGKK
jgi:hypothetical protein